MSLSPQSAGYELAGSWTLAPRMARLVALTVFVTITAIAVVRVIGAHMSVYGEVLGGVCVVVLLAMQMFWMSRWAAELPAKYRYAALFAEACLVYLPIIQFKQAWQGQPGFLVGALLIALPPLFGWIGSGLVVISLGFMQAALTGAALDIAYIALATILTGVVSYVMAWFVALVNQMQSAREELAELAVARERMRFTRDLHDLLGFNLSAITLKTELALRLVQNQPARARDELVEILQISRQALTDVRAVTRSYREMSLADECESARLVLAAAEVRVQMELNYRELPIRVSTVLATVLREGITNLLRHSKAESCEIFVRQVGALVSFDMRNDGASTVAHDPRQDGYPGGSGLRNLSARVAELGGELTAERQRGNEFRLYATIPLADHETTHVDVDVDRDTAPALPVDG